MSAEPLEHTQRRKEEEQWLRRRRLERQLHDGASLRISALSLRLGLLRQRNPADRAGFQRGIGELQDELHAVLEELRDVAGQIYPPLLDQAGLGPALRELADRAGSDLTVTGGGERYGPAAEGAAYFAVAGCLAAAGPAPVHVELRREAAGLRLSLTGVDPCHAELVQDQARPLGGTVDVGDGAGAVSRTITVRIPCE